MSNTWRWIIGIVVGLALIGFLFAGSSDRRAYQQARGAIETRVETRQERIDTAVEMATTAVDIALKLSGDLPAQEAQAEVVKQNIQALGDQLKAASEARGEEAIQLLDQSIDKFNQTLDAVESASRQAESPAVKSILDRIYGLLLGVKEQIVQFVLR